MKIGISIRVMGPQSGADTIASILQSAEAAGVDCAWIVDHIAIPPDDAEGSGGRYLDPLASLAWMAGQTSRIAIGTSVLILPYRPALPTAKAIATIQELSGNRLRLGMGIGWMDPEFKALGLDRHQRGKTSDETLAFFHECFANDVVIANDQPFLFRPRPERPPFYIGGRAPHAIERALKYGDGWMPMGKVEKLAPDIALYRSKAADAGLAAPEIVTFGGLDENDEAKSRATIAEYEAAGITQMIVGRPYDTADDLKATIDMIAKVSG